jgi:hypothetical protein
MSIAPRSPASSKDLEIQILSLDPFSRADPGLFCQAAKTYPVEDGCTCREVRYRLLTEPLFVHCCHCRLCQRETGTAFALKAMIEADRVSVTLARSARTSCRRTVSTALCRSYST